MPYKKRYTSRKRNRSRNFVAIPFENEIPLGTLLDQTVVKATTTPNLGEDLYVLSVDGAWTLKGSTEGESALAVGYAHDDLNVTEILEALTAELTDPDDIIAKERARRPVRKVGAFVNSVDSSKVLNNGVNIRTKIRISIGDGHALAFYAFNKSGATLTTGAIIQLSGVIYGRWQR